MTKDDRILKILDVLSTNVATVLEEQHAQRVDIRSLHRDVSDLKENVSGLKKDMTIVKKTMATKDELEKIKFELKDDIEKAKIELKADIAKISKAHAQRLTNLEDHVGISDPTKH